MFAGSLAVDRGVLQRHGCGCSANARADQLTVGVVDFDRGRLAGGSGGNIGGGRVFHRILIVERVVLEIQHHTAGGERAQVRVHLILCRGKHYNLNILAQLAEGHVAGNLFLRAEIHQRLLAVRQVFALNNFAVLVQQVNDGIPGIALLHLQVGEGNSRLRGFAVGQLELLINLNARAVLLQAVELLQLCVVPLVILGHLFPVFFNPHLDVDRYARLRDLLIALLLDILLNVKRDLLGVGTRVNQGDVLFGIQRYGVQARQALGVFAVGEEAKLHGLAGARQLNLGAVIERYHKLAQAVLFLVELNLRDADIRNGQADGPLLALFRPVGIGDLNGIIRVNHLVVRHLVIDRQIQAAVGQQVDLIGSEDHRVPAAHGNFDLLNQLNAVVDNGELHRQRQALEHAA